MGTGRDKLGYSGDTLHDQLINDLTEAETFYRRSLEKTFTQIQRNWKFYMGDREDTRLAHEKEWRANIHRPRPFSSIEVQTSTLTDIMGSVDRPIQPDPVGIEDEQGATKMERLLHYFTRRLKWNTRLDMATRNTVIQGIDIKKATWINDAVPYMYQPTDSEIMAFDKSVADAERMGAGRAPTDDPEALLLWRDLVNQAGTYGKIPEAPVAGQQELVQYRGVGWENVPIFDMRFDPMVTFMQKQGLIFQRVVKPEKWVLSLADNDPNSNLPYDLKAVQDAIGQNADLNRFSQWEAEIAKMMGLEASNIDSQEDPVFKDRMELFEIWRKGDDFPFLVMANRKSFINKHPDTWPYWHKQYPYHTLRNIMLDGRAVGITELVQNIPLFEEIDDLSNLRLDAVTLAILPILMRLKEAGMPEMIQRLVPGMIVDVSTLEGIKSLNEHIHVPDSIFREIAENIAETDETQGTQDIVRGASAPFSRTTASEIQNRLNRSLVRQTRKVARFEEELSTVIPQWLMLCYQFAPPEWRVRVGGTDAGGDPFQAYGRSEFLEGVEMDYAFRGASNAINKELRTQQLGDMFARAVQAQVNTPVELRALMKRTYESLGYKGVQQVFSPDGDMFAQLLHQQSMVTIQMNIMAAQSPQGGGGPPPEEK